MRLFSQARVDANGVCGKNVARHARVFFAHFDAAPKPAVFANVAVSGFAGALRAAGCVIGLRRLLICMRQRTLQCRAGAHLRIFFSGLALLALLALWVLVLVLVLVLFLFNGLLQHVNAAGCSPGGNVDRGFGSLGGDIHGGLGRVNGGIPQKTSNCLKRSPKGFAEPSGDVI